LRELEQSSDLTDRCDLDRVSLVRLDDERRPSGEPLVRQAADAHLRHARERKPTDVAAAFEPERVRLELEPPRLRGAAVLPPYHRIVVAHPRSLGERRRRGIGAVADRRRGKPAACPNVRTGY